MRTDRSFMAAHGYERATVRLAHPVPAHRAAIARCRRPNAARPVGRTVAGTLALVATVVLGCAGATPGPEPDPIDETDEPEALPAATSTALVIESEVGALDRGAIQDAFIAAMPKLQQCMREGRAKRQALIGGSVEPVVRIDRAGQVLWAYLRESTLGDLATETCILDVLRGREWPTPSGGKEGEASQQMELGEPDERPAVAWTEEDLGRGFARARSKVAECRRRADTGPISVTMFVEPTADGRAGTVTHAGAAASDEKGGTAAAECAARAVLQARVRSPGSYTAKVTVRVD